LPPSTKFWNNIVVATTNSTLPISASIDYRTNIYQNMNLPSSFELQDDPEFIQGGENATSLNELAGYELRKGSPALHSGTYVENNGGQDF
jgi:hypothetical protein